MPSRSTVTRLATFGVAGLLFEAVFPRAEASLAALGASTAHYAFSPAGMLHAAVRAAWLVALAAAVGWLIGASARNGAPHPRATAPFAPPYDRWIGAVLFRILLSMLLTQAVLARGALCLLLAMPAVLALTIVADADLLAAFPLASAMGPAAGRALAGASALALLAATFIWLRLALVEPAAILEPSEHRPLGESWRAVGRARIGAAAVLAAAWLPILIERGPAALALQTGPSTALSVLELAVRAAFAPYAAFYRTTPPATVAEWAYAAGRWAYLAAYAFLLARVYRR